MSSLPLRFLLLSLALPACILAGAPPASCYTDNNKVAAQDAAHQGPEDSVSPTLPDILDDTDETHNFLSQCSQDGIYSTFDTDWHYQISYNATKGDNGGESPNCSDLLGDAQNLVAQCSMGGVLQHWNEIGHKGNLYITSTAPGAPNTPREPSWWD